MKKKIVLAILAVVALATASFGQEIHDQEDVGFTVLNASFEYHPCYWDIDDVDVVTRDMRIIRMDIMGMYFFLGKQRNYTLEWKVASGFMGLDGTFGQIEDVGASIMTFVLRKENKRWCPTVNCNLMEYVFHRRDRYKSGFQFTLAGGCECLLTKFVILNCKAGLKYEPKRATITPFIGIGIKFDGGS